MSTFSLTCDPISYETSWDLLLNKSAIYIQGPYDQEHPEETTLDEKVSILSVDEIYQRKSKCQ